MSFETGVFPVLVSEDEAVESLPPQVRGGLNVTKMAKKMRQRPFTQKG